MDLSFCTIFDAFTDAVVICRGGEAVYANPAARALFGGSVAGRASGDLFGITAEGSGARSGSLRLEGGVRSVSVSQYGDMEIYRIDAAGVGDELKNLADSFSAGLRTAAANQRFASEIIRQYTDGIDDEQFIDSMAVYEHNSYRIARDADNIGLLGTAAGFAAPAQYCNPLTVARELVISLKTFLPNRHIAIECSGLSDSSFLHCSTAVFERILMNLISNAVKYSPADSTVYVSLLEHGSNLRLQVKDSGCGIPSDRLASVFDTWRLPRPLTDPKAGLGLGLHVVRSLALQLGGTVMIESRPKEGTAVTVELPLARGLVLHDNAAAFDNADNRLLTDLADVLDTEFYRTMFLD